MFSVFKKTSANKLENGVPI